MTEYKNRNDVPEKYKWDLTDFFKNSHEWEQQFINIKKQIKELPNYKGILNNSKKLEEYLEKYFTVSNIMLNLYVYSYLKHDVELENSTYIEMFQKISSLYTEYNTYIAFFEPELLSIDKEDYNDLFKTNNNLNKYKAYLDEIYKEKAHILSENEEKLIGLENVIKVFQSNFFGAIMEGQLELQMYEHVMNNEVITADYLNNKSHDLLFKYRGNTVKLDKYSNLMWVTRSHYYTKFYLFSYAISVAVAAILAEKIINKEPGILEKYYKFLKAGSNLEPIEIYKILDIDIENIKVYEDGINYFNKQLDLYENLLFNK